MRAAHPLRVTLALPRLRQVEANGSGRLQVGRLQGQSLALNLRGSGSVTASATSAASASL